MMKRTKHLSLILLLAICAFGLTGCDTLAKDEGKGVVIARRAQIRSSVAVVAADLLEVERGARVDILDSATAENGERWLRVRAHDPDSTEGWIEARNVLSQEVLDRSQQLADESKDTPAQATGQLRAVSNLRITPDRSNNENILLKLESGARFEIVGWRRVPKPGGATEAAESDDAPRAGVAPPTSTRRRGRQDAAQLPEEVNELWYNVRLPSEISPAPAGWVFGRQVELTVPGDIIFYRTGREFVAWQRLDDNTEGAPGATPLTRDAAQESRPGSWVILEKGSSNQPRGVDDPDFDRIYVLGYDPDRQEHYTAYRSPDMRGRLPLRVEGGGDNRSFSVRIQNEGGEVREARFRVTRNNRGILQVEALDEAFRGGGRRR